MTRYISSDSPIEVPEQDKYRRDTLIASIVTSINSAPVDKSTVLGLFGKWGSGKTSVINLVSENLKQVNLDRPAEDQSVVIRLNPWLFPNAKELSASLMKQISDAFQKSRKANAKKLSKLMLEYASVLCGTVLLNPILIKLPVYVLFIVKSVDFVREKLLSNIFAIKTLSDIRSEIDHMLREEFKKTIIVLDDVDRLEIDEICEVMQFIRGMCDFPNTVWVLSCDKTQVSNALNKRYGEGNGETFLEKIYRFHTQFLSLTLTIFTPC